MGGDEKPNTAKPAPAQAGGGEPEAEEKPVESKWGIKETKPVEKRKYTLTEEALAARRYNALKSTGPVSTEGKAASARNSWRHGMFAATTSLGMIGKPCVSTCYKYPCALVLDGAAAPGGDCADKEYFLDALQKIQAAIVDKQLEGVSELLGFVLAKSLTILNDLQDRLLADGTIVKNAKIDKDGRCIGWEHAIHPALIALPKLLAALGISFGELLLTPAAIAKAAHDKDDDEKEDAMTTMARVLEKMADKKVIQ